MKITVESTTKIVHLSGIPARIWEGRTQTGIPVHVFITRIAVASEADTSQFDRELAECSPPSAEVAAYPAKLIL